MIENEFKLMLTKQQYDKILSLYEWDKVIDQTNIYYDTKELTLSSMRITCRVRKSGGGFRLQMKLPAGADFSRVEVEQVLECAPDTLPGDMLTRLSGTEGLPDVFMLGELSTTRRVRFFDGAEIDLDESSYFGRTDYEVEVEFTDEQLARRLVSELKQAAGITSAADVCEGKIRRFLREYGDHLKKGG